MASTKRIILMRHAKSSWKSGAPSDHERPLNKRGRRDSPKVGAALARLGWTPDHVLSSDSSRTTETFARMRASLGFESEPEFLHALYHGGTDEIRDAIRELPGTVETVLVLGHNPGWEEALEWLSGRAETMKTGCAALLTLDAESWPDAADAGRRWALASIIYPREL